MLTVTGKIFLKDDPAVIQEGHVYVQLLDTSRADAASVKVTETVYPQVKLQDLFSNGLQFQLQIDEIDPRRRYEINVLVDLDGDGKMGKGDYISMQAYPVLTKGYPDYVEVEVSKI